MISHILKYKVSFTILTMGADNQAAVRVQARKSGSVRFYTCPKT
jgi:hypothetical protein